jgi:hypothetical protein
MPNWCSNSLVVKGSPEQLEIFKNIVKGTGDYRETSLSFNSIIPRPKSLDIESGSDTEVCHGYYKFVKYGDKKFLDFYRGLPWVTLNNFNDDTEMAEWLVQRNSKSLEEAYKLGENIDNNIKTYGASTWYNWNISNWGTKWDASSETPWEDNGDNEIVLFFETAWSPPIPVYGKIDELFPELDFVATYAEGGCAFVGKVEKEGEYYNHESIEWESDEGQEIARDLGQGMYEEE